MPKEELNRHWPELLIIAADLRRIGQPAVADMLIDAARAGSDANDAVDRVGIVLRDHCAMRPQLSCHGINAWESIMTEVSRAFRRSKFAQWISSLAI